jgi:hypothetical protein
MAERLAEPLAIAGALSDTSANADPGPKSDADSGT